MSKDGRVPEWQWLGNATRGGGVYSGPPYYPYKPRIVLHQTVSMGLSRSYAFGHSSPPHLWANPYTGDLWQAIELDQSAYALYQADGFHWTNKATYCLQVELVGVPVVSQATYTDVQLRWIAANVVVPMERWLRARKLSANIGNYRYHTDTSGSASVSWPGRLTEAQWGEFNGLCAHIDVWGNDHWDCSAERLDLISKYALEAFKQPPPVEEDIMATIAEMEASITKIVRHELGSDRKPADGIGYANLQFEAYQVIRVIVREEVLKLSGVDVNGNAGNEGLVNFKEYQQIRQIIREEVTRIVAEMNR